MSTDVDGRWPSSLTANAWTETGGVSGAIAPSAREWAARDHFASPRRTRADARPRADLTDWTDDRVGWGLLLPHKPELSRAERGLADDVSEPVRELAEFRWGSRQPVVLRYEGDSTTLYRYTADGRRQPVPMTGDGPRGAGIGQLPRYLLIVGPPDKIPWDVQFALNPTCFVGRLDLDDDGLENYVCAALTDWAGSGVDATRPLLWSVQHEPDDITWLMRQSVGERVYAKWTGDAKIGDRARALRVAQATCGELVIGLAECKPGVVVTTSHGLTGPASDPDRMRATLGLLVDANHAVLDPQRLLTNWEPDGVVWYGLACCSAGGSGRDQFDGLLDPKSRASTVMRDVSSLGPVTAPLPRMLLGQRRPARAFIGHVEPTLDWTLRRPDTGLVTTHSLVDALYEEFFQPRPSPVGFALRDWFVGALALRSFWVSELADVAAASDLPSTALLANLAAIDRQCTVILGDPAVAPAPLPPDVR